METRRTRTPGLFSVRSATARGGPRRGRTNADVAHPRTQTRDSPQKSRASFPTTPLSGLLGERPAEPVSLQRSDSCSQWPAYDEPADEDHSCTQRETGSDIDGVVRADVHPCERHEQGSDGCSETESP